MAKQIKPRPLTDHETELVRMVGQGMSNTQIAEVFGVRKETIRSRLHTVYKLTGVSSHETDPLIRVRLAIWAFDHGIVTPAAAAKPEAPRETLPEERLGAEFAAPMIRLALDLLADKPRRDYKQWARRVVDAAGLRGPAAVPREWTSVRSVTADEARAA